MHNSLKFCHFLAIYSTNLICFTNGRGTGKWLYLLRTSVSSAFNKNYSSNAVGCISSTSLIFFYHIFSHRHNYWKLVLIIATLSSIKSPFLFIKAKLAGSLSINTCINPSHNDECLWSKFQTE